MNIEVVNSEFQEKLERVFEEFLNSAHHAFLLETRNRELVFEYFKDKIESKNTESEKKENLFLNLKIFDIEKAREMIEYGKTNFSEHHFIVISFYSINLQAQNALLKFIEEAEKNIKVIFIIHKGANIIPTIVSRVYRLEIENENIISESGEEEYLKSAAEKFLKTKKINRMNLKEVKDILSRKDEYALENEDKERSDREILEKFLINIHDLLFNKYQNFVLEKIPTSPTPPKEGLQTIEQESKENPLLGRGQGEVNTMFIYQNNEFLEEIEDIVEAVKYAKNNSSSGKTLIEYLALKLGETES